MYDSMVKYGGLGLSANQVGLPYRIGDIDDVIAKAERMAVDAA